ATVALGHLECGRLQEVEMRLDDELALRLGSRRDRRGQGEVEFAAGAGCRGKRTKRAVAGDHEPPPRRHPGRGATRWNAVPLGGMLTRLWGCRRQPFGRLLRVCADEAR